MVNHIKGSSGKVCTSVEVENQSSLENFRGGSSKLECDRVEKDAVNSTDSLEKKNESQRRSVPSQISADEILADQIISDDKIVVLKGNPGTEIRIKEGGWLKADSISVHGDTILIKGESVEYCKVEFEAKGSCTIDSPKIKEIKAHSDFY